MRFVFILLSLIVAAGCASAQFTITKPAERSGPQRLLCLDPGGPGMKGLINTVNGLTRQQVFGIEAADRVGRVQAPCDVTRLPTDTEWRGHSRWVSTSDGYWIQALTVFMNGRPVVIAYPEVARRGPRPIEFYNFQGYHVGCPAGMRCPGLQQRSYPVIPAVPDRDGGSYPRNCARGDIECTRERMNERFKRN